MFRLPIHASLLVMATCLAAAPAAAAQHKQAWERVGDWRVSRVAPGTCAAMRDFADGTRLFLTNDPAGNGSLAISNPSWPMRGGQAYKVALALDGARSSSTARGIEQDAHRGVAIAVEAAFVRKLFAGQALELFAEDDRSIARLNLAGIAASIARMRGCVSEATGAITYAAPPAPPPPPAPSREGRERRARASVPPGALVTMADYPAAALRVGEQGRVGYRLEIGTDGRVTGCTITSSSGSAGLDEATCTLLSMRARFTPARDRTGRPTTDAFSGAVIWRLEPELPPPPPTQ